MDRLVDMQIVGSLLRGAALAVSLLGDSTRHIIHPPLGVADGIVVPRCNDTVFHEDRLVRMFLPTFP